MSRETFDRDAPCRFFALPVLTLALTFGLACTTVDRATVVDGPPPTVPSTTVPETTVPSTTAPEAVPAPGQAADFDPSTASLDTVLPVAPEVRTGTLDNGLTYYIRENGRPADRAELRLAIDAGSILEDDDQLGLAHFVEHMAFNGTENFEKHELVDYLQGIGMRFGADINASTGFDQTVYVLTVPTDDAEILDTAFLVLADWAGRVSFDDEEVEKERGVVVEEWRRSQGAGMRIGDRQLPEIFAGSRYPDRLPIGTKESIETAPPEALRRFYRDWYRPDLMAVTVAGDVDTETVEKAIRKHLGALPAAENPRQRPETFPVPDHEEPRFSIETDPEMTSTQVAVLFKREAEGEGTVGDYRRGLVEGLHAQMLNARLAELSQAADPPFVFAAAGGGALVRGTAVYQLQAMVPDGGVEIGLGTILREVERVDRHGFGAAELERAKADILRSYEQLGREADTQPSASFADEYVRAFLTDEPIPGIEAEVEMARRFLSEITLDEVNALGSRFITDDNRVILVSAPEEEGAEGTVNLPPSESTLSAVFEAASSAEVEPWVDRARDQPLMAEIPRPGKVVETTEHAELGLTLWRLSNGVRVALRPTDFRNDQVLFSAWSPGGSSLVADEDFVSANFATFLLGQGGLGEFDTIELQKALSGKVASVGPYIGELDEGLNGRASPEDLETLFQLVHLTFTQPRLDRDAYTNLLGRMRAMVENRSKDPSIVFRDELGRRLSQDHPRRRPLTTESLDALDPDRALAIYRDRFADASDFTFVFVGNFDAQTLEPLVETYLASLPAAERTESWRDIGVVPPRGVDRFEVRKGLEPKATLSLSFYGDAQWVRERRFQMTALTRVLEISLTELIREELGAAYSIGVRGGLERWPKETYDLSIGFTCDPQQVDGIVEALFGALEKIRDDGPDPETVAKVRENLERQRQVSLKENSFWLGAIETYLKHGLDLDLLLRYDELLETLDARLVQDAARRYLDLDQYMLGVLLPDEDATSEGVGARTDAP